MTASPSWNYQRVSSAVYQRHELASVLSRCLAVGMIEMIDPAAGATNDIKNATATAASIITWLKADLKSAGLAKLKAHGARALTFTTTITTPGHAPATVAITGLDITGAPLTETLGISGTTGTVTSLKCYSDITSLVFPAAAGTGATIAVGIADKFGLPSKSRLRSGGSAVVAEYLNGTLVGIGGNATAVNQAATAVNQNATAVNQNATAGNQAETATNQNATAVNQNATAGNQAATATNQADTATNQAATAVNQTTVSAQFLTIAVPAVAAVDSVHAAYAGDDPVNDFPGAFTNPDVPRGISVTFAGGWDAGDVTVYGTSQYGVTQNEVITANPGNTVNGTLIFATVTAATKAAQGAAADAASIGCSDMLGIPVIMSAGRGLLACDQVPELGTWNHMIGAVTPTTATNGARNYDVIVPATHTHVQDSHNHTQDSHNHTQDSHNHTQDSHNHTQDAHNHTQDSHNHTQDSHTHTQDAHTHTQDAHNHTQNAHSHNGQGTYAAPSASLPFGAWTPATTPNGVHDYALIYEEDVS